MGGLLSRLSAFSGVSTAWEAHLSELLSTLPGPVDHLAAGHREEMDLVDSFPISADIYLLCSIMCCICTRNFMIKRRGWSLLAWNYGLVRWPDTKRGIYLSPHRAESRQTGKAHPLRLCVWCLTLAGSGESLGVQAQAWPQRGGCGPPGCAIET